MRFSICNEIFSGWKLEETFAYASQLGYDGVEIAPFTLADSVLDISAQDRRAIRDSARRHGITVAGLHWLLVKPEGLSVNHSDPKTRQRTADYLCALVDFCADVGGHRMVFGSPKQRNVLAGVTAAQAEVWALETFASPLAQAAKRDVTLCFEPLGAAETNFVNTAAEAIRFVQRAQSAHFRIVLDVKAMSTEAKPIPEIIRASWPHFAHFHANDPNRKGPGFGAVDFRPIATALKEVGYGGFVSVEVFDLEEGPEAIASRSLDYLRKVFA